MTCAACGARSRTAGSATPTVTVSRTRAVAPATDTGSVIASVELASARSPGPTTSTVAGSTVTCADDEPARRRRLRSPARPAPSRMPDVSKVSVSVDGVTCTTSTPNGARTCSGVRWNSRRPAARLRRSSTADDVAGARGGSARPTSRARARPPSRGASPTISRPAGNVLELERHAQRRARRPARRRPTSHSRRGDARSTAP